MNTHTVLVTDGYILHTRAVGEADRILTILTPQGLLEVSARSVRKETAKLRQSALPYRQVKVSVVRGKRDILKDITVRTPLKRIWSEEECYTTFVLLLKTVRDHIPPAELEEPHLFNIIESATTLLEQKTEYAKEILTVGRVLIFNALGYVEISEHASFKEQVEKTVREKGYRKELEEHLTTVYQHL